MKILALIGFIAIGLIALAAIAYFVLKWWWGNTPFGG